MLLKQYITTRNCNIPHQEVEALLRFFPRGVTAFDVETTGLSPLNDRIIELSAVKILPNRGVRTFSHLINPGKAIPEQTRMIHGISDEMVQDKPPIHKVLEQFLEFNDLTPLIGHNAKFDAGFFASALHFTNRPFPEIKIYCSLQLAKDAFKQMPNYKLATLAKELNICLVNHHRALDDSLASLRIFAQGLLFLEKKNCAHLAKKSYLFSMEAFDKKHEFELPEKLQELKLWVREKQPIELKYKGGSHRGEFRPVTPLAILPMPHGAILYGLCELSNQHKSFKLSKISAIRQKNKDNVK